MPEVQILSFGQQSPTQALVLKCGGAFYVLVPTIKELIVDILWLMIVDNCSEPTTATPNGGPEIE